MVWGGDDLGAWLVGLLADAGRRKLAVLVLGDEVDRALGQAATAAVQAAAAGLCPGNAEQAGQVALVVGEVFSVAPAGARRPSRGTVLEALISGIAGQLAVLDDQDLTGTGQSSAQALGIPASVLSRELTRHLLEEIVSRGARGGPLAPLASQLNDDVTHLQGRRLEVMLTQLGDDLRRAMAIVHGAGADAPGHGDLAPAAGLPVRLAPRLAVLAGREALLAEIGGRLTADPAGAGRGWRCCAGWEVRARPAWRSSTRTGSWAEWGSAGSSQRRIPAVLTDQFKVLAAQLGAREPADARDPVAAAHAVLAQARRHWLVVFDNAPDLAAVEAFLPPAGPGRVVVTSQSQHWPPGWAVQVPVLEQAVAAQFLTARTRDGDQRAALDLAGELGGLPLALEQAAAYMEATSTPLSRYLSLFRARQADLLARGEAAGHREHTAATLSLALARLAHDAPAAAGLMRLLAFLAPEPVPLDLLLAGHGTAKGMEAEVGMAVGPLLGDPVAAGDAVAALRRYSLAAPAGDGLFQVHRLVQAITRAELNDRRARHWRRAAATLVEAAVPADAQLPRAWQACAVLLPHARAVLDPASDGISRIAQYLGYSGSYQAARDLSALIADARRDSQDYGSEHPGTLSARHSLARWTGEAGSEVAAREQFAALVPVYERVQGSEHPGTMDARASLARWTGETGDPAAARDQMAALVPVYERVQGPEHPETMDARFYLARWTGEAGDPAAARDQFAALVPIRERVQGPEHPDTLGARISLARWTGEAGDAAAARDQFAALVPIRERVQGPEHPSTLGARVHLARWTGEAGDAAAARDQFAVLLPIHERVHGPEYRDTLTVRQSLARWTGEAGDAPAARDQLAALLPVRERTQGPEHPTTRAARRDLERWTRQARTADPAGSPG